MLSSPGKNRSFFARPGSDFDPVFEAVRINEWARAIVKVDNEDDGAAIRKDNAGRKPNDDSAISGNGSGTRRRSDYFDGQR